MYKSINKKFVELNYDSILKILVLYIVAVSVSYSVKNVNPLTIGVVFCFPPRMHKNINKKFVELNYA